MQPIARSGTTSIFCCTSDVYNSREPSLCESEQKYYKHFTNEFYHQYLMGGRVLFGVALEFFSFKDMKSAMYMVSVVVLFLAASVNIAQLVGYRYRPMNNNSFSLRKYCYL